MSPRDGARNAGRTDTSNDAAGCPRNVDKYACIGVCFTEQVPDEGIHEFRRQLVLPIDLVYLLKGDSHESPAYAV